MTLRSIRLVLALAPLLSLTHGLAAEPPVLGSAPVNDLCTSVTPGSLEIGATLTFNGDNTDATFAGDAVTGSEMDLGLPSVWHAFTTTDCADVTISYCGIDPVFGSTWNWLALSCPADEMLNATSFNTDDCTDGNKTLYFNALPAGTYYLPVLTEPFSGAQGPYVIEVNAAACGSNSPENDLCASVTAADLAVGSSLTFTGDNTGATFADDAVPGSFMDLGLPSVWHAFTTTDCADVTISYCGIDPVFGNTWNWLALSCPADVMLNATTFNSDDCGDGNKTLYFNALPAGTYYLPVLTEPFSGAQGPYAIEVSAASCGSNSPENDICGNVTAEALTIGGGLTFTGDNTGATFDGDAVPGSFMDLGLPSVWHAFTTTDCADVTISYCGIDPVFGNTWNWLALSCPADVMLNATTFNSDDCGDGNKTLYFNALPAGTYYLPVLTEPFSGAQGPYTLEVTAAACGSNSPPNDLCSNVTAEALAIGSNLTFTGNNTGATFDGDAVPDSEMDLGLPSVWHAFTTTDCSDLTVSYCGIDPAFGNTWNWLALSCPADDMVNATTFNTDDCGDGNKTIYFNALPAGTYYLPVLTEPFSGAQGPYTIVVTAAACGSNSPENDLCTALLEPTPIAIGGSVIFTGNSQGATLPGDAVTGSLIAQVGLPNVWHYFSLPECSDLTVEYCGTDPAFTNVWNLLATSCPADELVYSTSNNTDDCGDGNRTAYYIEVPAGNYYLPVLVDPFSGSEGPYTVTVSATNSCPVSVSEEAVQWQVINSTAGQLRIRSGSLTGPVRWELMDAAGRSISVTNTLATAGTDLVLDLGADLASGIYMLQAVHATGRSAKRVLLP